MQAFFKMGRLHRYVKRDGRVGYNIVKVFHYPLIHYITIIYDGSDYAYSEKRENI